MAGVNNPTNLKPLIDAQTQKIDTDNYWRFESVKEKIAESQQVVEVAISESNAGIEQKLESAKATTQNAIAQSVVDSESATNAARDLIISNLGIKFDEGADFDIYHPKTLNTLGLNKYVPKLQVTSNVMEKVYGRVGGGAITHLRIHDRIVFDVFIDGVKVLDKQYNGNQVYSNLIPSVIPYLKYKNSVEIYANTNNYSLEFIDWRVY
jgi:hypothetical protein